MKRLFDYGLILALFLTITLSGCGGGNGSPTPSPTPTPLWAENFDSYTAGQQVSADWVSRLGGVVTNTIQGAEKYLVCSGTAAIYNGVGSNTWSNYTLTCRFKTANSNDMFGFVIRCHPMAEPGETHYQIVFNGDGTYTLSKNLSSGMNENILSSGPIGFSIAGDVYYNFKITVNESNIKAFINNNPAPFINYNDSTDSLIDGSIGFAIYGGALFIDDIVVTPL